MLLIFIRHNLATDRQTPGRCAGKGDYPFGSRSQSLFGNLNARIFAGVVNARRYFDAGGTSPIREQFLQGVEDFLNELRAKW